MRTRFLLALAFATACCPAAFGRDMCVDNALADAQLAFARLGFIAPEFTHNGPPELALPAKIGQGVVSVTAPGNCDLTVNGMIDRAEPAASFVRLVSEAAASVFNVTASEVAALLRACLVTRPAKYDETNVREGLRRQKDGVAVECSTSLYRDLSASTFVTVWLKP